MIIHRTGRRYVKQCSPVFAYVAAERPDIAFLLADDDFKGELVLHGQPWLGRIKALWLKTLEDGTVAFADAHSGGFASARELDPTYQAVGGFQVDNAFVGPWEAFHLRPVSKPPAGVQAAAARLRAVLAEGDLGRGLGASLTEESVDYDVFQACGRLLDTPQALSAMQALTQAPDAVATLARQGAHDRYAAEVTPRLSRWLQSYRQPGDFPRRTGVEDDEMERVWFDAPPSSFSAICAAGIRSLVAPVKRLAVLATVRNEGLYLLEWLAHHIALGVEAFFIYTNDNDDGGSGEMLEALAAAGVIRLIENEVGPGVRPQYKAYGHALQALPEILDYAWVAAIDADEFLRFNETRFESFDQFLRWQESLGADAVALSWLVHTPNRQARYSRRGVIERFPGADDGGNAHIKSVFRPNRFRHADCHFPVAGLGEQRTFTTADGREGRSGTPFNHRPTYDHAWVGHYYFKSVEEYLVRRMRNRGNAAVVKQMSEALIPGDLAQMVVSQFDRGPSAAVPVSAPLAERTRWEAARLSAIPGVMEALASCEARLAQESSAVQALLAANPRFSAAGSPEAALLALLQTPAPVVADAL